jgi:hypothetical protein
LSLIVPSVSSLVGAIADVLTGCRGGDAGQKASEETVGTIRDKGEDLMKDLFGVTKKR